MFSSNINKIVFINFCQRFHLYIHAYALLLLMRGLSLVQISLIESVVIGTIFLMEAPTGVLADRLGRKWSIVFATFFNDVRRIRLHLRARFRMVYLHRALDRRRLRFRLSRRWSTTACRKRGA